MDKRLLEILVCPVNKTPLVFDQAGQRLISLSNGLSYPVRDGIPILLADEATQLSLEEVDIFRSKQAA